VRRKNDTHNKGGNKKMFGISGTAFGGILRATKKDYKEISAVAGIYGVAVLLLSVLVLFITSWSISDLTWMPESIVDLSETGAMWMVIGSLFAGSWAFLSMLFGALVFDVFEKIAKSV
jgi:hypothetical protein